MIPGIESYFQIIADSMTSVISEEWANARFEAIFYEHFSMYEAEYTRKVDGKLRGFQPDLAGSRAYNKLRQQFKKAGKRPWGRAVIEIDSNGKFRIQFGHENCDEAGYVKYDEENEFNRLNERLQRLSTP